MRIVRDLDSAFPLPGIDFNVAAKSPVAAETGPWAWLKRLYTRYRVYRMKRGVLRYFDGQPSYLLDDIGLTPLDIEEALRALDRRDNRRRK